jgi:AGCS family alanine or glycine:cation symporter
MKIWVLLSNALWNPWLFLLFFIVGGYYSFRTGFSQLFDCKSWLGQTMGPIFRRKRKRAEKGKLTQFQAMATALGSTVGTSSIAGVATAIYFGGPGAVFWMWVSAFLGMMTGYAEKVLAIRYRKKERNGGYKGGPPEYIKQALKAPGLSKCFCVACIFASFSGGNLVQANSIASGMQAAFGLAPHMTGGLIAGFTALVILGGIGRIGRVSSALVPMMALLFTGGGLVVLLAHYSAIPIALYEIVRSAFTMPAVAGGGAGYCMASTMRYGVARGVFTNEAGLGSSAMAHAVAETDGPHQQGLWGMLEVFLATLVIATVSALVIMTSGIYRSGDALRTLESGLIDPDMVGVPLVVQSFETVMGVWSGPFIAVCLTLFAISSILGWSYYGERCMEELLGSNRGKILYRMIFIALIMVGSVSEVELVWEIADLFNGLMALPNLIALLLLSPKVLEVWNANREKRLLRKRQVT